MAIISSIMAQGEALVAAGVGAAVGGTLVAAAGAAAGGADGVFVDVFASAASASASASAAFFSVSAFSEPLSLEPSAFAPSESEAAPLICPSKA